MKNKYIKFDKYFFINFCLLIILALIVGAGLEDYDNLLSRSNYNIYENIVRILNPNSVFLLIFNIMILSLILGLFYKKNKFLYFLVLVNPFILLNTFDAYNKFMFITFFLYFSYILIEKNYKFFIFLYPSVISLHPFYMFSLFYSRANIKKFLIFSPIIVLLSLLSFEYFSLQEIIEKNRKFVLFMEYSLNLASMSEGNMVIKKLYTSADLGSYFLRVIAMIFPYGFIVTDNIIVFLLSIYQIVFLSYVIKTLKIDRIIILFLTILLVTLLVGNFAVFNRHFLPLLLFFLIIDLRNKNKIKKKRLKVRF